MKSLQEIERIMTEEFQIGVITQTHGVRGEVKVFPTTDDTRRFKKLKNVTIDTGKNRLEVEVEGVKFFKQYVIMKFKEFNNINDVEKFKTAKLIVDRDHAVPLRRNEYYVADLIGMQAVSDENESLGIVKDVLATGANDVYIIENDANEQLLVPAIKECILDVDLDQGRILIHVMDGLRD